MSTMELMEAELIQTLYAYNRGVLDCTGNPWKVELTIYLVVFVLYFLICLQCARPAPRGTALLVIVFSLVSSYCIGSFIFSFYVTPDTSYAIYARPHAAARYACNEKTGPIPMDPLFEEGKHMFADIYNKSQKVMMASRYDPIVNTIDILRALAIRNNIIQNCTLKT